MIRNAEINDVAQLVILGKKFFDESGYADFVDYDEESTVITMETLIESDAGLLVISESNGVVNGMAGGMAYPFYFNKNHITGQEFFWYLEPEHRGSSIGVQMFSSLEERAKEAGASTFMMVALDSLNPDIVGHIYEKCGYRKSEHTYIRSL